MIKKIISFCALLIIMFTFSGCSSEIKAHNLMKDITASPVNYKPANNTFLDAAANFSVELFKNTLSKTENSLISPTSVLLALSMTANGADNETLAQMEAVLGGQLSIQELNDYLHSFVKNLPNEEKSRLNSANSIWFKENDFTPSQQFLQTNADYYGAAAYKSAFDNQTVKDINNWVKKSTDGLINSIVDKIPSEAIMYLINTVLFDAEWRTMFQRNLVMDGQFTTFNNKKQTVKFMKSLETKYLQSENVKGFVKPYSGNKYSFVALLPDLRISIDEYAATLTGKVFTDILKNVSEASVTAAMPKFSCGYSIKMNDALKSMGITDAFSPYGADFSKIGTAGGNIFLSQVLHKAKILVDERGTKAGAGTVVSIVSVSAPENQYTITLDRPFIYAIVDNATKLPIFMGTLLTCK